MMFKPADDAKFAAWFTKKENVYTSSDIQNELIKLMGVAVLCSIVLSVQSSPFLTVVVEEMTDIANQ